MMLQDLRAYAERISQSAKQRLVRVNRDVTVFTQQSANAKDGLQNVQRFQGVA